MNINGKSFTDKISDETLAKMIDKTLNFEKTKKNRSIKINLLKAIPAVAVIALVIGAINIYSLIYNNTSGNGINPGAAITSGEDISSTNVIESEAAGTFTTQIDNFIIITSKEAEPIQNDDGTITLPGGGTVIVKDGSKKDGSKYILDSGRTINCNGSWSEFHYSIVNQPIGANETMIVELPHGAKLTIYSYDENFGTTTIDLPNGVTLSDMKIYDKNSNEIFVAGGYSTIAVNFDNDWDAAKWDEYINNNRISAKEWDEYLDKLTNDLRDKLNGGNFNLDVSDYFNTDVLEEEIFNSLVDGPWIFYGRSNDSVTYKLDDGTTIAVSPASASLDSNWDGSYGYLVFKGECTIEYTNGVSVNAPRNTKVEYTDGAYIITIGNGDATITQPDGTSSIVIPAGTILDSEGNAITSEKNNNDISREQYISEKLIWPLDTEYHEISCGFITGQTNNHDGFDIVAPHDANIYAVDDGIVTTAEYDQVNGYGFYIVIDHGGGITTLYGQAASLLKNAGDKVKQGDVIAKVGSTGCSTGNHLHFAYYENGVPNGDIINSDGNITK